MNKPRTGRPKGPTEKSLARREAMVRAAEQALRVQQGLATRLQLDLREANEHLVVATVHAQAMIEAAESATQQLSHLAQHDVLTGLPNRALLTDRLMQAMALAQRRGKRVALMFVDLDHFKHVNDSLGHAVGDLLLQSVARRLQACVRSSDTVCRQGGDEFVVLLAEVDAVVDATQSAEKLIEAMAAPHVIGDHRLSITLSIGISLYPDDGQDVETVLEHADLAMYEAKKSGRNRYRLFTPQMNVPATNRQSVEQALHHALDQHEFVLHYQPKVDLRSGTIIGAEALVRLQASGRPLMHATQFVGVAEASGLMPPIGRWVLREACHQASVWLQAGLAFSQMAVNVSAAEFRAGGFLAGIHAILGDTGLDPHHLTLELTTSALMQDPQQATAVLNALKSLGVQIAIDDFGTSHSSVSQMRLFPIDILKIDQSFVHDIHDEAADAVMVSTILAMGQTLHLRVVAGGIETPQQLAYLRAHACSEGQGHFLGKPLAAEAFTDLLVAARH